MVAHAADATSQVFLSIDKFVDVDFMDDPTQGNTDIWLKPNGSGEEGSPTEHTGEAQIWVGCNPPARLTCPQNTTLTRLNPPPAGSLTATAYLSLYPALGGVKVNKWTIDYPGGTHGVAASLQVEADRATVLSDVEGLYHGTITVTLTPTT